MRFATNKVLSKPMFIADHNKADVDVVCLIASLLWECFPHYPRRGSIRNLESLAARAFTGFLRGAKPGRKTALTTGLTTDRKIFDFRPRRGIILKTEYPGVVQLIERAVWDMVGLC